MGGGNCNDILHDSTKLATTLGRMLSGAKLIKLIDRDDRSADEIRELRNKEFKILSRRSIENYLWSDEILTLLCEGIDCRMSILSVLANKAELLNHGPADKEDPLDNVKEISGLLFAALRKILPLRGMGNDHERFASDTLAQLITPDTHSYKVLDSDIFG